jgi:glycosyltransferase involved in cell wall biosynthesis
VNILLTNSTDIYAGGEDYVLILARFLAQRGHTVQVSALPGHLLLEKCSAAGLGTVPINYRGMDRVFQVSRELRRELLRRDIRIVHSNANYDRTCAAIACLGTPARHVAGIHSTHSIQHNITHWMRNRWGTAHFITDADAGKEVLVTEDRLPAQRITTVPIGIEDDPEETRRAYRSQTRTALGIADTTLVIGNVARLVPFKGHQILLDAAARVLAAVPDAVFVIVGDGELHAGLTTQAERLGIAPRVRFLGFRDDLPALYPAFDVYCHSSLDMASEMFPIAILRALAAGLPIVCTEVGGIALMVDGGRSGILVPPGDPVALAGGVTRVLADPALRAALGAASRERFLARFHASSMAEQVERIYEKVLAA